MSRLTAQVEPKFVTQAWQAATGCWRFRRPIGTVPSPIVQHLDLPKTRERLVTNPDMRVTGDTNIWAIGDCAYVTNSFDNKPTPPPAQFAEREGRQAAENIVGVLRGESIRPFYFKQLGQLCSLSGRAVGEMFAFRISGFLAWVMWRGVYLLKLPSWSRRIRMGLDWVMHERGLTWIPVVVSKSDRHLKGYVRAEDELLAPTRTWETSGHSNSGSELTSWGICWQFALGNILAGPDRKGRKLAAVEEVVAKVIRCVI